MGRRSKQATLQTLLDVAAKAPTEEDLLQWRALGPPDGGGLPAKPFFWSSYFDDAIASINRAVSPLRSENILLARGKTRRNPTAPWRVRGQQFKAIHDLVLSEPARWWTVAEIAAALKLKPDQNGRIQTVEGATLLLRRLGLIEEARKKGPKLVRASEHMVECGPIKIEDARVATELRTKRQTTAIEHAEAHAWPHRLSNTLEEISCIRRRFGYNAKTDNDSEDTSDAEEKMGCRHQRVGPKG